MMLRCLLPVLACLAMHAAATAQEPSQDITPDAEVIVVRAERAGPQLWRVTHPEGEGEVYVFITVPGCLRALSGTSGRSPACWRRRGSSSPSSR